MLTATYREVGRQIVEFEQGGKEKAGYGEVVIDRVADAVQMNMYLNYAREHLGRDGKNPPDGLILCAKKGHDEARYALGGLGNKVLTSTYRTTLPDAAVLIPEVERTRRMLEQKAAATVIVDPRPK